MWVLGDSTLSLQKPKCGGIKLLLEPNLGCASACLLGVLGLGCRQRSQRHPLAADGAIYGQDPPHA